MKNFGYACINQGFSTRPKSRRITTNRTMIKRTFHERGIVYASELALQNLRDLRTILEWNLENDIYFFRISSDIIPWASEYDLRDMPNYGAIHAAALSAGALVLRVIVIGGSEQPNDATLLRTRSVQNSPINAPSAFAGR